MRKYLLSPISYLLSPICVKRRCVRRNGGFTLVEMVAVILIMAILMAALTGMLTRARNGAWRIQARETCREICEAWNAYLLDYREFPERLQESTAGNETTLANLEELIPPAANETDPDKINKKVYLELNANELDSSKGNGLKDRWGRPYFFSLDKNYDGKVENPYPAANGLTDGIVNATSIAWSLGHRKYDKKDERKIVVW